MTQVITKSYSVKDSTPPIEAIPGLLGTFQYLESVSIEREQSPD